MGWWGARCRFGGGWGEGVSVSIGVVLIIGLIALRIESLEAEPLLLSLAGFFFGLLLIEPAFFKGADRDAID